MENVCFFIHCNDEGTNGSPKVDGYSPAYLWL
jgi:hypothetical protein